MILFFCIAISGRDKYTNGAENDTVCTTIGCPAKSGKRYLKGASLSESMQRNNIFDNRIISLVKVAEETNQTEYVFSQLNEQFNQEVVQQSKIMATVLEPL